MQIEKLRELGPITQFEIHFDGDETPYRLWSSDEKHAILEAKRIAIVVNILLHTEPLNKEAFGR